MKGPLIPIFLSPFLKLKVSIEQASIIILVLVDERGEINVYGCHRPGEDCPRWGLLEAPGVMLELYDLSGAI